MILGLVIPKDQPLRYTVVIVTAGLVALALFLVNAAVSRSRRSASSPGGRQKV
jgi:hypothetical protein